MFSDTWRSALFPSTSKQTVFGFTFTANENCSNCQAAKVCTKRVFLWLVPLGKGYMKPEFAFDC